MAINSPSSRYSWWYAPYCRGRWLAGTDEYGMSSSYKDGQDEDYPVVQQAAYMQRILYQEAPETARGLLFFFLVYFFLVDLIECKLFVCIRRRF